MAEVRIGGVVEHVSEHMLDGTLTFHRIQKRFVLALRSRLRPGCAHPGLLEPDHRCAEHPPPSLGELLSHELVPADVAEYVEVGEGLRHAEGEVRQLFHDPEEVLCVILVAVRSRRDAARVTELIRTHTVGRIGQDHIELFRRALRHPLQRVGVERRVRFRGEGAADDFAECAGLFTLFFFAEDFEGFVNGLSSSNLRVSKVLRYNKLSTCCLVMNSFGRAADFLANFCDVRRNGSGKCRLGRSKICETRVRGSFLLPGEVDSPDVLFEFGFFSGEGRELGEEGVRNEPCGNRLAVISKYSSQVIDVLDSAEASLSRNEYVAVAFDSEDRGVEERVRFD